MNALSLIMMFLRHQFVGELRVNNRPTAFQANANEFAQFQTPVSRLRITQ